MSNEQQQQQQQQQQRAQPSSLQVTHTLPCSLSTSSSPLPFSILSKGFSSRHFPRALGPAPPFDTGIAMRSVTPSSLWSPKIKCQKSNLTYLVHLLLPFELSLSSRDEDTPQ